MVTTGEYKTKDKSYGVIMSHVGKNREVVLVQDGMVKSAFKKEGIDEYSYNTNEARDLHKIIERGLNGCTSKNSSAVPFVRGTAIMHIFTKSKVSYNIQKYCDELSAAEISNDNYYLFLNHTENQSLMPRDIPYIQLVRRKSEFRDGGDDGEDIVTRPLQEIALDKDIGWLNGKKYYIINNPEDAEKIFKVLDEFKGPISYDTETTGLRINMFGKIGSSRERELIEYNAKQAEEGGEEIRVDSLVGIVFCIEEDVSYYFPCANRKFDNLYSNLEDETTKRTVNNIKSRYTVGEYRDKQDDMAKYIRETHESQWGSDVILMERCRKIIEQGHIVAHNGGYEWKVGWL